MNTYRPARQYLPAGMASGALCAVSCWCGWFWPVAFVPAFAFLAAAAGLTYLGLRPVVTTDDSGLRIGPEKIPWDAIACVESTSWNSPLVLRIALRDGRRRLLVYPGDVISAERLLRVIRRSARAAEIDGVAYVEYWEDGAPIRANLDRLPSPRYRLLREEDEDEVERLYRRLRSAGQIDAGSGSRSE